MLKISCADPIWQDKSRKKNWKNLFKILPTYLKTLQEIAVDFLIKLFQIGIYFIKALNYNNNYVIYNSSYNTVGT